MNMKLNNAEIINGIRQRGSCVPYILRKEEFVSIKLHHSTVIFKTYRSETISVMDEFDVHDKYDNVLLFYWS